MHLPKTQIGRADLLRLLGVYQNSALSAAIRLIDYVPECPQQLRGRKEEEKTGQPLAQPELVELVEVFADVEQVNAATPKKAFPRGRFWYLYRRQSLPRRPARLCDQLQAVFPAVLRNIRPLRKQEQKIPDLEAAQDFSILSLAPRRPALNQEYQGKQAAIIRQVNAAAQLRPLLHSPESSPLQQGRAGTCSPADRKSVV